LLDSNVFPCVLEELVEKDVEETLTIAMPIWNRQYCIQQVLDSIINQTYPKEKIKLVFVDNFSSDGTFTILQKFAEKLKEEYLHIQIIQAKSNIPEARNICVQNTVGKYLLWWDSDVLAPDNRAVQRIIDTINRSDAVMVGYPAYKAGKPKGFYEKLLDYKATDFGQSFTIVKRTIFDKIGEFNPKAKASEETELCLRIKKIGLKYFLDKTTPCTHLVVGYHHHGNNIESPSDNAKMTFWRGYVRIVKRCFFLREEYDQFLKAKSFHHYFRLGVYLLFPFVILASIFLSWIIAPCYVIPLLIYQVKQSKNRPFGLILFFYYLLPGLATSYGYICYKIKYFFR
jgi:glycosyltransferase involved in cell wall biosynthesis